MAEFQGSVNSTSAPGLECSLTATAALAPICCGSCALSFCVPADLLEFRRVQGRPVFCPGCRRRNYFPKPKPAEDVEARRQKLLDIHKREQAEAAMEAAMHKALATCPQLREENPEPPVKATRPVLECPKCGKAYKLKGSFAGHLSKEHGIERSEARAMAEDA